MASLRKHLSRYAEHSYALLRIVAAFLFACHGAQKLFGVLEGETVYGSPLLLAAGLIEFFGGLLVGLGWQTSIAAVLASGEMAVAYFLKHAPGGFWPILNGGEKAGLYAFVFLFIASRGGGKWSLDGLAGRSQ